MDDGRSLLHDVAHATRELNRLVRTTQVDGDALQAALTAIEAASAALAETTYAGPHAQTGHGTEPNFTPDTGPAGFFPYSPVVGPLNPISPPVELTIGEDSVVRGHVTLTECYNGPPWDLTHGGVVAMIFDEVLGVAGIAGAGGGFTGRLTVRYHKPTPIGRRLDIEAHVTAVRGRKITAHATIHHGDTLTAEAEGLFISLGGPLAEATT